MSRLRVMQVVLSLDPGGTERLVIDLVSRLSRDVDAVVCCLDDRGRWGEQLSKEGVPVHALGRQPGFHPRLSLDVAALIRRYQPHVLHCHHYSPFVYGALGAFRANHRPVIFTEHGRLANRGPSRKRRMVNAVLARLPRVGVYAVSEDVKRHLVAEGIAARRVGVILNGIESGDAPDASARARARAHLGIGAEELVIGTAARLDPVKDLPTMLRAVAAMETGEKARLVVFGDGDEHDALVQLAGTLGLDGRVSFTGYRSDVRELLPALDVYANSSTSEGISLTILEAMAAALPVVATRVGGTPEVVREETGILVPARNCGPLADALSALASSPERRRTLGAAGRLRVVQRFSIDRMVGDYLAVYSRCANGASCESRSVRDPA